MGDDRQQVLARIRPTVSHDLGAIGEHFLYNFFEAKRKHWLAQKGAHRIGHELRCHFEIMHPVHNLLAIGLINSKHFAEGVQGQLVRKIGYKIDFGSVRLEIIKQVFNLLTNLLAQHFNVSRDEEILLLDPHLHVLWLVHADQIVHGRANEYLGAPVFPGRNR